MEAIEITKFMARVKIDPSGCWFLPGKTKPFVWVNGRNRLASRFVYELFNGVPPGKLDVCHRCDVPRCVNPAHLFLGTAKDNMADCCRKGRFCRGTGEKNNRAVLTEAQVLEIRRRYIPRKVSTPKLAREYGVSDDAIQMIISGQTWKHLLPAA